MQNRPRWMEMTDDVITFVAGRPATRNQERTILPPIRGVRYDANPSARAGAHDIERFGDTNKYDSFQKLNQPSPRYSFGTLARPLALSQSAQSLRRTPRADVKGSDGGHLLSTRARTAER